MPAKFRLGKGAFLLPLGQGEGHFWEGQEACQPRDGGEGGMRPLELHPQTERTSTSNNMVYMGSRVSNGVMEREATSDFSHACNLKIEHTSLAMSLEALAACIEMASGLRSYPFFFASSQPDLYSFCFKTDRNANELV